MSQTPKRTRTFTCLLAIVLTMAGWVPELEAQRKDADKVLALGDFYLKHNDVTDAADRYYKQVIISAPGTRQAGLAQYNRGSYWHKKFYILRERKGANTSNQQSALIEAEGQYYDFVDKFADKTDTTDLLADASYNLALVYLQRNNRAYALGWLNRMLNGATARDPQIYIYRVVWSSNPADVIDRTVDAKGLTMFTRDAISSGLSVDQVISQVKQWCRRQ
jgi:hypothetical protein